MAESIDVVLEIYDAPTFTLKTAKRYLAGVVGDDIVFVVKCEAVGAFTGDVTVTLEDYPAGAVVSYDPVGGVIGPGEEVEITVDTDACEEEFPTMKVVGTPVV